ncbi:ABC transporter ATP-binding protein [Nocardia sp. NPDC049190]|uniref:ABC transporter ATP-binding protein n=1 Tax=Nocardia sp. NPDC049190 TaxID=3155650 RepID=UPI0033DFBBD8
MSFLEVRGLRAGYGAATDVLHEIELDVPQGAAVGVIGANGAGKSSLLRVLAGLQPARGGTLRLDGNDLPSESAAARLRRGVVLLPEGHRVIRKLTVEENLRLAAISTWPRGVKTRLAATLPTVYELFPILHERRKQLAGLLSGGEQQMVSIGRALVSQPRLLLLDEPSLGLAPVVIDRIYESLAQLKQTGLSMLIVEQDYGRLNRLCDQMHVLRLGSVTLSAPGALTDEGAVRAAYFGHEEAASSTDTTPFKE